MIGHNGYMKDYVNLQKPSATRIAVKRAYRKAKLRLIEIGIALVLTIATTADFFS